MPSLERATAVRSTAVVYESLMSCGPLAAGTGAPVPRLLSRENGLVVGEIGNICVVLWRNAVTRERFEAQRVGLECVVHGNPEGAGFLCLIEAACPIPGDDMRRASADMIAIHRARLKYVACVMEGDGIRMAAVRLALTAMRNLVTGKVTTGFFATTAEAATHLGEYCAIGSPESLVASVEGLRTRFGA
jgi:hypothetical protein